MINPYQLGVTSPVYNADAYTPQQIQPIDSSLQGYGNPYYSQLQSPAMQQMQGADGMLPGYGYLQQQLPMMQQQVSQQGDPMDEYRKLAEQMYVGTPDDDRIESTAQQLYNTYQSNQQRLNDLIAQDQQSPYYTINKGDTLYNIARQHGISVSDLQRLNRIKNANLIRAGQRLRFNEDNDNVYTDNIRRMPRRTTTAKRSTISHNPAKVRKQVASTQGNGTMLPEVVVTAKRPIQRQQSKTSQSKKTYGNAVIRDPYKYRNYKYTSRRIPTRPYGYYK